MRYPNLIAFGLLSLAGAACSSSNNALLSVRVPGSVKLKVGAGAAIQDSPWTLQFDSVISDSRCPIGVLCIQAGEALLAMELTSPMADAGPQDNPHFSLGITPVTIEGLRFTQVEVSPLQRQNVRIDPKSYVVTIMIEASSP